MFKGFKKKTLIIPHIPKCGGTSVLKQLKSNDLKLYYDNDAQPHSTPYWDGICQRRNMEASLLNFGKFDAVIGHFPISRYLSNNYSHVTLIRHPLERAISQFFYWKNTMPDSNLQAVYMDPIIRDIKSGQCTFENYLIQTKMDKFLSGYFKSYKDCRSLVVFDYSNYPGYIDYISNFLSVELDSSLKVRVTTEKNEIDKKTLDFSLDFLEKEIKLYEELLGNRKKSNRNTF